MRNKAQFYKTLVKQEKKLQNKMDHPKLYNIRNLAIRTLLKSGIAIDYALPFIMSSIIVGSIQTRLGITPLILDDKVVHPSIETIDTSSGLHLQKISYDFNYDEESIEYTTGWKLNNNGLYERTSTSYRINKNVDITNVEKLLSMSKEELDDVLVIINVENIYKETLSTEDMIYEQDAIIVINNSVSKDECMVGKESIGDNVLFTILFIIISSLLGFGFKMGSKILIKTRIRDKLGEYQSSFQKISSNDLEKIKQIIESQKQNLALLDESVTNINESDSYIYKLRSKVGRK